jgi:cyclophilin family peptidyl-prolyl cis-trans isomerase
MKLNQKVGTVLAAATLFFVGALSASPVFADETTSQPTSSAAPAADPVVVITTSMGKITVKLDMTKAPISTTNFIAYVKAKHYDGTIFHRVIPSFMIQGGGMTKDLSPKPGAKAPIKNEAGNGLTNDEGTIAMARTNVVDSATDQFFINVKDNAFLNHSNDTDAGFGYAVFGKVTSGMDVVHKIEHVETSTQSGNENVPVKPVTIKTIRISK